MKITEWSIIDRRLYIQEADYIFKRPIIYSRGRLYIQEVDYIFLIVLSDWSIQQIEIKIIIQKIKVIQILPYSNWTLNFVIFIGNWAVRGLYLHTI